MEHHLGPVSRPQLDALWEFLNGNKSVADGNTFEEMRRCRSDWETAAVVLNAIEEDCYRDWRNWAQFWIDIKFGIRQKMYHQMQSPDKPEQAQLSDIETRFSQFVDNIGIPLEHIGQKIFESRSQNVVELSSIESKKHKQDSRVSDKSDSSGDDDSEDDKPLGMVVRRRRRVIQPQLDAMFQALRANKWVTGGCNKSAESRHHYRKFWEKAASTLNAIPKGDHRNWRSWAKYWVDYKAKANKKLRSMRGDASIELSSNDLLFMQIINASHRGPIRVNDWETPIDRESSSERTPTKDADRLSDVDNHSPEDSGSEPGGDGTDHDIDALDIDALSQRQRRRLVTTDQLAVLYQCLQHNPKVALGRTKSTKSRYEARLVWKKAAKLLNAVPDGEVKDWKGWSKYWIDLKAKTKKRVTQVRTGQFRQPLSDIELKLMQLINVDVSDLGTASVGKGNSSPVATRISDDYEMIPERNESNLISTNASHTHKQRIAHSTDDDTDIDTKRSKRVSLEQLNALWECINANKDVAFGRINTSELRKNSQRMWMQTAERLNAIKDGDVKTWKAWSKYWVDLKGKVNHRVRRINAGESDVLLTASDRRFLELIRTADKAAVTSDNKIAVSCLKRLQPGSDEEGASMESGHDTDLDDRIQSRRVSLAQQNALWESLNDNKEVAFGYNKTAESRHSMREMWTKTARTLNSIKDGDVKSWKAWSKYWVDVKAKLNSRLRRIKAGFADVQLTNTDLRFLQLIQGNANTTAGNTTSTHHDTSLNLAKTEINNLKPPKKKKKYKHNQQKNKYIEESQNDSDTSNSNAPSSLIAIDNHKEINVFKQEHVDIEGPIVNSDEIDLSRTQNTFCTDCSLDKDSVTRNQTYSNLLLKELQYLPACMRSQAYINMLRYLETLKKKHSDKTNSTNASNDFYQCKLDDGLNADPLNELL